MASGGVIVAAIEAGGSKFALAVLKHSSKAWEVLHRTEVETTTPEETIEACCAWFRGLPVFASIERCGVASFGPVELSRSSSTFGYITTTPKPGWANTDLLTPLTRLFEGCPSFRGPIGFDTDVNAAALAHASTSDAVAYITVGTGVGVGIVSEGRPVHGLVHPEMGHIFAPKHREDSQYEGTCPFHGSCVEGMVASRSIAKRVGVSRKNLDQIADSHEVWQVIAHYLSHLVSTLVLTVSPKHIVIGGGILQREGLLSAIQKQSLVNLNGYINNALVNTEEGITRYLTVSPHGANAGLFGAGALALLEHE